MCHKCNKRPIATPAPPPVKPVVRVEVVEPGPRLEAILRKLTFERLEQR